jgi:hypothetical protein
MKKKYKIIMYFRVQQRDTLSSYINSGLYFEFN